MDEIETTPKSKPSSPWAVGLTCGALVVLLVAGGMFAMRDQLLKTTQTSAAEETAARQKLSARIDSVQSTLDTLGSQPAPGAESLAVVDTKLADISTKLDALSARVETLEKKPEPVAAAPAAPPAATVAITPAPVAAVPNDLADLKLAVLSGKPFAAELAAWGKQHPENAKTVATLSTVAESGLPTEADLNRKLRAALDDATAATKVDDTSVAGKINTHLAGLVSIKKTGQVGTYDQLRKDVLRDDVATLTRSVEALNDTDRKPLDAWLAEARTRQQAVDALAQLDAGSGH